MAVIHPILTCAEYDDEIIKHLHEVLMEMFKDLIKICDENNIKYFLHGGSNIGAVRHGGFIPWDDEIDIALLRDDYEKLIKILDEENEKYYIENWKHIFDIDDSCYTTKTLFCLKNTRLKDLTVDTGIFIDLNVLDNIPENKVRKFIFVKTIDFVKLVIGMAGAIETDLYVSKNRERIGHILKFAFDRINFPNHMAKLFTRLIRRYNGKTDWICSVGDVSYNLAIPKKYFDEVVPVKFEGIYVNMLKEYDKVLKVYYEDYMEIPPIDKRFNHDWEIIDFGEY